MASLPPRTPPLVAEAIEQYQIKVPLDFAAFVGMQWSDGQASCEGAKYHSPTPLVLWRVSLHPKRRYDHEDDAAWLCANCVANLRVLQSLQVAMNGEVPWPIQREFANQIRALARRGWELMRP